MTDVAYRTRPEAAHDASRTLAGGVKRAMDVTIALVVLLPLALVAALVLSILNAALDPGPLLFVQKRMGRNGTAINVVKFRSMTVDPRPGRDVDDPLETTRITRVGRFIRRTRIDELPQALNVLRGDMSVVGPRPDYLPHALHYARTIPGYRARHAVRPGITGLAQVRVGYAEGSAATRLKVAADLEYVQRWGVATDLGILVRTVGVVLRGGGA